jgi:endo-1,4-beta-xylanase
MKVAVAFGLFAAGVQVVAYPQQAPAPQLPPSIDAKFKAKGKKYFGVATDIKLLKEGRNAAIISAAFGQVTPENRCALPAHVTTLQTS